MSTLVTMPAAIADSEHLDDVERAILQGCARGDREAMAELYQRYQRRVYNLVLRMVGPQEADSLAQDSFVRIFRGAGTFRGKSALSTWIYRLTMNVCLSFLSKRSRRSRLQEQYARSVPTSVVATQAGNPWLRRQLEQALLVLPPGYRAVLLLHDVEGLSHQEIADILGCREGTSKSQLHKARMRMRELLEPALREELD